MKNLERRQREMRERSLAANSSDEAVIAPTARKQPEDPSDVTVELILPAQNGRRIFYEWIESVRLIHVVPYR